MMLLVDLLHGRMGCSQAPSRWSLNINGFLTLQSHIMLLFERVPWRGQSPPSWSPVSWSCFVFLVPSLQHSELHHVIITAGKTSLTYTFPTSSSLFVSMGSSRAPPLIRSSITCVKKFSSIHSRNLLDCLWSVVPSADVGMAQVVHMNTRACQQEAVSSCPKVASSSNSSWKRRL